MRHFPGKRQKPKNPLWEAIRAVIMERSIQMEIFGDQSHHPLSVVKVIEAAKDFIEAWDRFYEADPADEKNFDDLVCDRLVNLKDAVMQLTKEAG